MSLYLGNKPISSDGSSRLTGEIGDMGFAPLGIDESLNLRRYLNGQVISQIQFEAFTAKVKSAVALYPSLATTEDNWQAEKALSNFSQVGKFVIDDENQTIRLPAVVNAQGLLGLTGIGGLVNESLPNISGGFTVINDGSGTTIKDAYGCCTLSYPSKSYQYTISTQNTTTYGVPVLEINPSNSSATYQDDAPVQQEAIQYPYYIQVATGIEETLPAIREYGINTPFFFGQSIYSENAPYNASWLASNGQYNASNLYPDMYTQLNSVELNTSLNVGDTIEISGKTYVKRGLSVVLSTDTVTDYDFVVNQNDQTFRLPLLNGEEDLLSNKADLLTYTSEEHYIAPANGWFTLQASSSSTSTANIYLNNKSTPNLMIRDYAYSTGAGLRIFIPAKKGDNVQAGGVNASVVTFKFIYATGNGTLYFYVGDVVQDASLVNAGTVLNALSGKVGYDDLTTVHCVVETYHSGTSWYRVYDDGWVEQGGLLGMPSSAWYQVTFLKPFADTNYAVVGSQSNTDTASTYTNAEFLCARTSNTYMQISLYSSTGSAQWIACGYGA